MRRGELAGLCAMAALTAFGLIALALSLDDPLPPPPPPRATQTAVVRYVAVRETAVVVVQSPTRVPATSTPKTACYFWTRDGDLCIWPTSTQTIPIPDCDADKAGQACIWHQPTIVVHPPTPTPVWPGPETAGKVVVSGDG